MEREVVQIYDTSLRDGLRNSGISMNLEQKLRFARQLEQLNIDAIEIGYGGPSQIDTMQKLATVITGPIVYGLSRVNLKDVDRVVEGVGRAKTPGVNIFSPTSNDFLKKAKKTWQQAIDDVATAVMHAKKHVDHITFSAQDASRADPVLLVRIFNAAIEAGATTVSIADSVSYAVPSQFGPLCQSLRSQVVNSAKVAWSVHCHNEIGLAVANSLAAIENGVRQVECTVDGIGEGQGNTSLQLIVNALQSRADVFKTVATAIATEYFPLTSQLLTEIREAA
jgi:2-isopropylmalate synthase